MGGSSEAAEVGCRIISTVDVLVVGGGPAGIGAAVGAAYHENLRVAIVDEGGCFGGAVPKSLITFAEGGVVCSGDQLLIKGVWQRIQDEVVIAVAVFAVFYILLNRTLLGKYAYAIGGNSETARLSGIKVNLVRCVLYILTALMSSFVGILMSSRINSGDPNLSTSGIEFEIIVAIILGGTSLLGGQGSLIGTLIGALILGNLSNGMNLLGIGTVYQFIVEGAVLVVAVVLDLTLKGNGLRIKKLRRSN